MKTFEKHKMSFGIVLLLLCLAGSVLISKEQKHIAHREVSAQISDETKLIPGGFPIGIYMETDGVMVLKTTTVTGIDGKKKHPAKYLLQPGDYIVELNHEPIRSKKQLLEKLNGLDSQDVILKVRREKDTFDVNLAPEQVENGEYKLGIWIRDNMQGLGTVTFMQCDGSFGALGHGIHDVDTNELVDLSKGRLYKTKICSIQKGKCGVPGGLEGVIAYNTCHMLGKIEKNTDAGIFGKIDQSYFQSIEQNPISVARKEDIQLGEAYVRCMVDGYVRDYKIEIERLDFHSREKNKGILLQVTDPKLLKTTGGIIQGMSGSPVIQNGRIVGAVTHVLVNDPTRGYGIFIENMLEAAE